MKKSVAYLPSAQVKTEIGQPTQLLVKVTALVKKCRFQEALTLLESAEIENLNNAELLNIAGMCAASVDELSKAEDFWRRALQIRPNFHSVYNDLAVVLQRQYRFTEAEDCYHQAVSILPSFAEAHSNLGTLLEQQARYAEAEQSYRRALGYQPNLADVHRNLGNTLLSLKRYVEAEQSYRQAIVLGCKTYDAHLGLAGVLGEMKRYSEAEKCYRLALGQSPNSATIYNNRGNLFFLQQRYIEAEADFRKAVQLNPDYAEAHHNLGMLLNLQGRFSEGWKHHEYRYHWANKNQPAVACHNLPFPQWQGQSLLGRSIVVWPEQGFGDQIQFCRYCTELRLLGATKITLLCYAQLKPLFQSLANVDTVLSMEERDKLKPHDYWSLLLSLPLHCGTALQTIPAGLPYLYADPRLMRKWSSRLPKAGLLVGLVWQGSMQQKNDQNRSIPSLRLLTPLWRIPGVVFISLQKGPGEKEAATQLADQPILSLGPEIKNFADTAAIISQLDLVISVCTSTAHLAGALNKPCWVLLPGVGACWRWLQEREDSPWYPEIMRLFRQGSDQGWAVVINEVALALEAWQLDQLLVVPENNRQSILEKLEAWLGWRG